MTTQTKRSKDAARPRPRNTTPTSKPAGSAARSPAGERLRKEALATVAANIAKIDAAESGAAHADHNEQGAQQPAQPAPDERKQNVPDPARKGGKREKKQGAGAQPVKAPDPAKAPKAKRLSCLDAAAQIIGKDPIGCQDLIAEMAQRGLWKSPSGKTPASSLYAAIIREIAAKKGEARFKKVDRGLFVANSAAKKGA